MAEFALREVQPIGKRASGAFVDYADGRGGMEVREFEIYPDASVSAGEAFREYRVHGVGLSLREAATLLGISVVELCDLERGRKEFVSGADRDAALLLLGGCRG